MPPVVSSAAVAGYLETLRRILATLLAENLHALYLAGSSASGDFDPRRSDLDILLLLDPPRTDHWKAALTDRLRHDALPCPAEGLDLLALHADEAAAPPRIPWCAFSLSTGTHWPLAVSPGEAYAGALIDLALCREKGTALAGPPPRETIGAIAPQWLEEEMRQVLRWHRTRIHHPFHDPTGANAVLNACRAWRFFSEGALVSKSEGARWARTRKGAPPVVATALQRRRDAERAPLPREEVLALLDFVEGPCAD